MDYFFPFGINVLLGNPYHRTHKSSYRTQLSGPATFANPAFQPHTSISRRPGEGRPIVIFELLMTPTGSYLQEVS
jgi:hypothetical protein